jgi:hypothetical protein
MTTTQAGPAQAADVRNPHRIPARLTGWGVVLVFLGAMRGAGHDPKNAAWSAAAVVLMVGFYLSNKVRQLAFDRHTRRGVK